MLSPLRLCGCWAFIVALLCGCSSAPEVNVVRPDPDSLRTGTTRYTQIIDRFGPPVRESSITRNGRSVRAVLYSFSRTSGGAPTRPGVAPERSLQLFFSDDVLVGYEFASSYGQDATDFDERRASQIVKGKSSRDDVVRIFGPPGGVYVYPMIEAKDGRAILYQYVENARSGFDSPGGFRKSLVFSLDAAGLVRDFSYTTTGSPPPYRSSGPSGVAPVFPR